MTEDNQKADQRKRSAQARQKVEERARKLLPKVLDVYKKGMDSQDERHAKSCADAIRDIAIGKPGRQPQRDDSVEDTSLIFGELPNLKESDGDGKHQSLDLESD